MVRAGKGLQVQIHEIVEIQVEIDQGFPRLVTLGGAPLAQTLKIQVKVASSQIQDRLGFGTGGLGGKHQVAKGRGYEIDGLLGRGGWRCWRGRIRRQ